MQNKIYRILPKEKSPLIDFSKINHNDPLVKKYVGTLIKVYGQIALHNIPKNPFPAGYLGNTLIEEWGKVPKSYVLNSVNFDNNNNNNNNNNRDSQEDYLLVTNCAQNNITIYFSCLWTNQEKEKVEHKCFYLSSDSDYEKHISIVRNNKTQ